MLVQIKDWCITIWRISRKTCEWWLS